MSVSLAVSLPDFLGWKTSAKEHSRQIKQSITHHSREPVQSDGADDIDDDEHPKNPKVSPSVAVLDAELRQEDVGLGSLAELAVGSRSVVDEVTAGKGLVWGHVLSARLAVGRVEDLEFGRGAFDRCVGDGSAENALDKVGEWRDSVHELPETGEGVVGDQDTAC